MKSYLYLIIILFSSFSGMAANRYWIASAPGSWNNTANWSASSGGTGGASIPGSSDIANFNNLGTGNCSIPATVSLSGLVVNAGYTGTITQSANPFSISGAVTFAGGSFVGSSSTMTFGGTVNFSGTSFTFPALVNMNGTAWTYTSGTLDAATNNSTVLFGNGLTITGSHTLNNVTFNNTTPWNMTYTLASGTTLTANGNMTMTGTAGLTFSGGTLNLLGNLSMNNTGTGGGGSTVLVFAGTGSQAITGSPALNQSNLPSVNINKTSGTLTLPALLSSGGSNWTYTAGTIDATTNNSTVAFVGNITITGNQTLNNIQFDNATPWAVIYTLTAGTVVTANGNMSMTGTAAQVFTNGTVNVMGNLNLTNTATGGGGSMVIGFTGTGAQSVTSSLSINQGALPSVNINKTSGTLTLPVLLTMGGTNWTYTTGTIDATTNNSTVVFDGNTTITGSHTLKNIHFTNPTPWGMVYTFSSGTVLTAAGDMTTSGASSIIFTGGTINLPGNLVVTNTSTGDGGTTYIAFTGTTNQAITSSLPINQGALPSVNINKASGTLTFPALLTMAGTNWTYTTGTVDATTNNSTVVFGGSTTFTGSHTLNNINFTNATPWGEVETIASGTVLTVSGNMTTSGASAIALNGGTINLQGNLAVTNTSTGDGGSTVLTFMGTGNQAITSSLPVNQGALPAVNINKASGTLSLPALITVAGSTWTYTTGTVDVTTAPSTVAFNWYTTINAAGMSFYNLSVVAGISTVGNALTVSNNLSISSPGVLSGGANTINLAGNWSDWGNGGFTEGSSTVNFNGAANQTITTPGGEIFYNMTTNNSAANIQLINNATVSKTLTMTQGNVDLNSNTFILGLNTGNPGTLAYTAGRFIGTGSLTRWFKTGVIPAGSVAGLFPVGNATDGRPFSVSAPTSGPTTGGTMTMTYTDGTSTNAVSFPDGASTVAVIKSLHWALATGNGLAGGTYNPGISGTNYGLIGSISDLRLTLVSSVVGTAGTNAGTTANPQVNRTGLSLANLNNTFYLGSVNPTFTTLPVQLLSFTAQTGNGRVLLNWSTSVEINSALFTVQRSANGSSWSDLDEVAAAGNSDLTTDYSSTDQSPLNGVSLYRLKMKDKDGATTYSFVVTVHFGKGATVITVYPNPAVDYIGISFSSTDNYTLTLINESGQVLEVKTAVAANSVTWNVSNRTAGVYFMQIRSQDGRSETRKVVVRR